MLPELTHPPQLGKNGSELRNLIIVHFDTRTVYFGTWI